MINVCHILDSSAGWEQRVTLRQLIDRMPEDRVWPQAASLGPLKPSFRRAIPISIDLLPSLAGWCALSAPFVARWVIRRRGQLVHAWSVDAAASSATVNDDCAIVLSLFDPLEASVRIRLIRTLARARRFAVACSCQIVRRRLIEGGVSPQQCVVIRPGVDFAAINRWKRSSRRVELAIASEETLIVLPEPVTQAGGQHEAFFAVSLLAYLGAPYRVVVPGDSPESERITRFSTGLLEHHALVRPDPAIPFEEIVAAADALLIVPRGDYATTSIAWAMASGALVIGTAVYSVAELISHKVNGLLYKQTPGRSMLPSLAKLLAGAFPFEPQRHKGTKSMKPVDQQDDFGADEIGAEAAIGDGTEAKVLSGATPNRIREVSPDWKPEPEAVAWEPIEVGRLRQAAHGQAYEVFGLRRSVEQYLQLYRNLLSGAAPDEGISDSAMTG